ncbi:MAG: MerR family transcriptional regulator, partial [Deltaproteobacteria bacterium]|nr:MerR family transcriptional regulator [Deltaproteobacteria bacterium]
GGQRRYTEEHIIVLEQIKNLRASGKSITEIKDYFRNNYNRENQADEETAIDMLTQRIAELVKLEVTKFLGLK